MMFLLTDRRRGRRREKEGGKNMKSKSTAAKGGPGSSNISQWVWNEEKRLVVTFIIRKLISFLKRCFPSGEITRSSQSFFGHDAMMTPNQGQELDAIFFPSVFNACMLPHFQFHFQ